MIKFSYRLKSQFSGFSLVIAIVSLTLMYSLILPPFSGVDEIAHYNSVVRVYENGGWPRPYEAKILAGVRVAVNEAGFVRGKASLDIEKITNP